MCIFKRQGHLSQFIFLSLLMVAASSYEAPCFADTPDDESHADLAVNSAYVALRGRTDSYGFVNVMPEFRWRFNGIDRSSWFISVGSPLISNVNASNPASSTSTKPTPLFHTNFETSVGYAIKVNWSDAMLVMGVGYMNIQTDQSKALYDKGPYGFIGLTISLLHSD